jgi:PAS domain S-box-containing protein
LIVCLLSYVWIFYIEDTLLNQSVTAKWHFVILNSFFASIAVIIPAWLLVTLEKSRKRLDDDIKIFFKFAENSGQGFAVSDLKGVITYANQAFSRITEETEHQSVVGKQMLTYYPKETAKKIETEIIPAVMKDGQWTGELNLLSCTGKNIPIVESVFPVYEDKNGSARYLVRLITDISEQKDSERAMKQLPRKMIEAQENERIRIASELHDSLAQNLLVINTEIQTCIKRGDSDDSMIENLTRASTMTTEALDQINEIAHNVRPAYLDKSGFERAIKRMAETITDSLGITIFVEIDLRGYELPKELEITIYRIIQEALNNIMKHSGAGKAYIDVTNKDDSIEIHISDDGKGFEPDFLKSNDLMSKGHGLLGIKERVKIFDGSLSLDSDSGEGATLMVSLPLRSDSAPGTEIE